MGTWPADRQNPWGAQLKGYIDDLVGALSTRMRTGTGSPEGVVTAPVGTEYVDSAATNGAVKWIKASGTGNTGWRVVFGDTGWRQFKNVDMLNGWTVANESADAVNGFYLRRVNAQVWLHAVVVAPPSPTVINGTFFTSPLGFRPDTNRNHSMLSGVSPSVTGPSAIPRGLIVAANGNMSLSAGAGAAAIANSEVIIVRSVQWLAASGTPWPTGSLPGTAAPLP